jgi:hypothetical protein
LVDRVANSIPARHRRTTKWQRIENQINAAMIFARSDFVKVL